MTAGCGLARTFWQLAVMRMGVGVGEASLSPSAYSLISDYFRPERRSTAMSVYSMGIYIGSGLAFLLGGSIMQLAAGTGKHRPCPGSVRCVRGSSSFWSWVCRGCWYRFCCSRCASRFARACA